MENTHSFQAQMELSKELTTEQVKKEISRNNKEPISHLHIVK